MTQPDAYDFGDNDTQGTETIEQEIVHEVEEVEESVEEPDEDESEDQGTDSESSADSDESHDKNIFTSDQQRVFDDAIGKKVFKLREKEREAEDLRRRLDEYERSATPQGRPRVPSMPDPFALSDQDYRHQSQVRDQAIIAAASYDAKQQMERVQHQRLEQEAQNKQQEAMVERVQTYAQRAKRLGVKADELQVAGSIVGKFGIDQQLVDFILEDDKGPLITKYLSQNLAELDTLRQMHPTRAAVRIATLIKGNAVALKPKVSNAPEPLSKPRPSGVQPKLKGLKGATFE